MKSSNWVSILLVVSIGLNLLFAGVLIGRSLSAGPFDNHRERPPFDWAVRELSEQTREDVRQGMREHRRQTRPLRRELRAAQQSLQAAVIAEPFEPAQVEQAFARLRDASLALQVAMHAHIGETLASLPGEERRAMLRRMQQGGKDRHPPPGARP